MGTIDLLIKGWTLVLIKPDQIMPNRLTDADTKTRRVVRSINRKPKWERDK